MKPLLIGIANPYPGPALAPVVPGCAGWRLWKIFYDYTGATAAQYLEAFDRANLDEVYSIDDHLDIILLGTPVWNTLVPGCPETKHLSSISRGQNTFYRVPHPSGRNLWFNDPSNRYRVASLMIKVSGWQGRRRSPPR